MPVYRDVDDAIEGERIVCEFAGPRRLKKTRLSARSGHREWRIKLYDAYCVIERKFRWLGER